MASTLSAKSQRPLHNFPLPQLNYATCHRGSLTPPPESNNSKILLRFGRTKTDCSNEQPAPAPKMWKLRPRKPPAGKTAMPMQDIKTRDSGSGRPELSRTRVENEAKAEETLTISIPLTKKEIEEDFWAMTGSKPLRKPKKRSREVKRKLDKLFPGLNLVSISAESYRVQKTRTKG